MTVVSATSITAMTPAGEEGVVDVVVANSDGQSATLTGGFEYLGIVVPTLTAVSGTDMSKDYSEVGSGDVADGSDGEAALSVRFTDNTGGVATGQDITWTITNSGEEAVYVVAPELVEIAAGATEVVTVATDANGLAPITVDAEADRSAGTTSILAVASVTAPDSDGEDVPLEKSFAVTWDVPVAAELASFTAELTPAYTVFLQWEVASQSNNLGWEVFRSVDHVHFEPVGELVAGDGTTDEFKSFSFADEELPQAEVLYYYLKQVDLDGTSARSSMIEVQLSAAQLLPTANSLWQNFPNPFNPETTIAFDLSEEMEVTLTIYDLTGQVIRTLVQAQAMSAGQYRHLWDGRDNSGTRVSSGIYLYQLRAGDFTSQRKMILLQ